VRQNLENLTSYAAAIVPSMSKEGVDLLMVVVSGRFSLPRPGARSEEPCPPTDEQPPVRLADEYRGEPDRSSLRYEGQSAPGRLATDVVLEGHAWAPRATATTRVDVTLTVHQRFQKTVAVIGEREYGMGVGVAAPGAPQAFVKMPLVWERAFGGAEEGDATPRAFEPRNPVGRGFFGSVIRAIGAPAPNLEDPADLVATHLSRPRPMGFGPVARHWQPRLGFAGTYDQRWIEELAPNWPPDFDRRFFQSAPADQQVTPHLEGGEWVGVSGVSPEGPIRFRVPADRIVLKSYFRDGPKRKRMTIDQLLIEPDEGTFTVTWRALFPLSTSMFEHQYSIVRPLEKWEDAPR